MSALLGHGGLVPSTSRQHTQARQHATAAAQPLLRAAHVPCSSSQQPAGAICSTAAAQPWASAALPAAPAAAACRHQRRRPTGRCQATTKSKPAAAAAGIDASDVKEAHKIFDEAFITVKSGDGGAGEVVEAGRGKFVKNLKYHAGGNQRKQIWLPASAPADGADGADVFVVCDPSLDSLLHLHARKTWSARKGAHGNPAVGSAGPKRNAELKKAATRPLEIPVPPGTVVKRKSTGQVLGEVLQPGDRLLVAKGGKGGRGLTAPSRLQKQKDLQREFKAAQKAGAEVYAVEDVNWQDDARGLPGQQLGLQLLLRVVADVGLVGFPNAGKSSLLGALTRASPEVAPYPFTTLMPNLGVMAAGGRAPVLADLPGLIEGAHVGKGLGRMFLRHLSRTRLLLHVVDAATADPATDYLAVREELRMYNPSYVCRPHVVALNKVDLEDAGGLQQEIADEVASVARALQQQHADDVPGLTAPAAIVACSAVIGHGLQELAAALQAVLEQPEQHGSSRQRPPPARAAAAVQQQQQQQQADGDRVAATVAAALGEAAWQKYSSSSSSSSSSSQTSTSDDAEDDDGARLASLSSVSLSSSHDDWDGEEAEEEEEGEWAAWEGEQQLAAQDGDEDEDEEPVVPASALDDVDVRLLALDEEELLRLADEAEERGGPW